MRLLAILRLNTPENFKTIIFMDVLSALAMTLILWLVNAVANTAEPGSTNLHLLALYVLAVLMLQVSHNFVLVTSAQDAERLMHVIRARLFNLVRRTDLVTVQKIGRATIFQALNQDVQALSGSLPLLGIALQQGIMLIFICIYLAWLSPWACLLAIVFAYIVISSRARRTLLLQKQIGRATDAGVAVFDRLTDLLQGFKEIRMDRRRAADVVRSHSQSSAIFRDENTAVKSEWGKSFAFVEGLLYIQVGVMVFVVPLLTINFHNVVTPVTTAMLFFIGPVATLAYVTPIFTQMIMALDSIESVESRLSSASRLKQDPVSLDSILPDTKIHSIALRRALFRYQPESRSGTVIGPLNAEFRAGQITFITGGNGSGKSTMLRMLTGLLPLSSGELLINGQIISELMMQSYRDQISAIFSDYHISRRLYSLDAPDTARIQSLLEAFELSEKVEFKDGAFSTVDLSSGQRRRLAMIVAMLEDKPIIVLDEWAADQDPHFRALFYEKILPDFKSQGKLVICVTHDDRWFSNADNAYHMIEGKFV